MMDQGSATRDVVRPAIPVILVSGLSGAGKSSILRTLEDMGFEAVDNAPLTLIEELAGRSENRLAIGVDARTRGFNAEALLALLARLRQNPALRPELIYASAQEEVLLRRYTETRRRHPLAPHGRVRDGIAAEAAATAGLREAADLLIDTTDLPAAELRRLIERTFGADDAGHTSLGLMVSLVSFAFPAGLPREADLVFDARFLRNPHYDLRLRPQTGLDPEVAAYVEADPDFAAFFGQIEGFMGLLLPRFVQEGKKYVTVAIGCTGGRHRSVHLIEKIAAQLGHAGYRLHVTHRELARLNAAAAPSAEGAAPGRDDLPVQSPLAQSSLALSPPSLSPPDRLTPERTHAGTRALPPVQAQEA